MEQEKRIEKPLFEREPDFVNSIGTRFWKVDNFDNILSELPIDVTIFFSEYTDVEGEEFWGYLIVEGDNVLFETPLKEDVIEILETVKQESIERGFISE
jgi:hypothetical protein